MRDMRSTTIVVTYCSRDKDPSLGLLPAEERYLSGRIRAAAGAASRLGLGFRILSGLYGLLEAGRMIPDYDHLLTVDQVPDQARKLAGQLAETDVGRVVFITRAIAEDPGVGPYRQALLQACASAEVECKSLEIGPGDPSITELVDGVSSLQGPVGPSAGMS